MVDKKGYVDLNVDTAIVHLRDPIGYGLETVETYSLDEYQMAENIGGICFFSKKGDYYYVIPWANIRSLTLTKKDGQHIM